MNATPSSPPSGDRALVLGGGGATGNAWVLGVVAGLVDAGLDVSTAEVTVGTSSGATAAAQLAGTTPTDLFAATLAAAPPPQRVGGASRPAMDHLERTGRIIASAHDAADMRRRMGAAALELDAESDGSWSTQWRAIVATRLPGAQWPRRALRITAVDAETGAPIVFDRDSGVDLVDAVAASCSSGLPYRIGHRRFIDGGYRRNENADVAAGCSRVLVLSPFAGRTRHPLAWGMQLATQVEELRAAGSEVEVIVPDGSVEHLFGANAVDLSLRPAAAQAGYDQGRSLAGPLAERWR